MGRPPRRPRDPRPGITTLFHRGLIPVAAALWGSEFSADGSRTRCPSGTGTGEGWREWPRCHGNLGGCERCGDAGRLDECEDCDGEGWRDCVRGYSCYASAEELASYMRERAGEPADDWCKVVVFEGEQTDTGHDDEPCAVPTRVIAEVTWSEFTKGTQ